jgi:hypothetical protein
VVRSVSAVRRDLDGRGQAWGELDGRFRGWVVVRGDGAKSAPVRPAMPAVRKRRGRPKAKAA